MTLKVRLLPPVAVIALAMQLLGGTSYAQSVGSSEEVVWTCTGSDCPWGSPLTGHAVVWPESKQASVDRMGYTVSGRIYLSGADASGMTIGIETGAAAVYAGGPDDLSHRLVATIFSGETYTLGEFAANEVVSVQSGTAFTYHVAFADLPPAEPVEPTGASLPVTWTCTSVDCPWGYSLDGIALVWPEGMLATASRLGYTTSDLMYLPASSAEGLTIAIESGTASVYAGAPDAPSHRWLATISSGQSYTVTGLAPDEVISVQADAHFAYTLSLPAQAPPDPGSGGSSNTSLAVAWSCTTAPCPWGSLFVNHALVWPPELQAIDARLGYTTSQPIYLSAEAADGLTISVFSGAASVYAGVPGAVSHRLIARVGAGESYTASGLADGELLSVLSDAVFTFEVTTAGIDPDPDPDPGPGPDPDPDPDSDSEPEPEPGTVSSSALVTWSCTATPCPWGSPLTGHALVWPTSGWATGARLGYTASDPIYAWAEAAIGATIEVVSGAVSVYAGGPMETSHRLLATISAGGSYTVTGVSIGEVVSFQSDDGFTYRLTAIDPGPPPDPGPGTDPDPDPDPEPGPDPDPDPDPGPGPGPDPGPSESSALVTWSCTTSPCPWGWSITGEALVWPVSGWATGSRLGYTTSNPIYALAPAATGATIEVVTGTVSVYAGHPMETSHRLLATVAAGQSYTVSGVQTGEVVSFQSDYPFTYRLTALDPGPPPDPETEDPGPDPGPDPDPEPGPDPDPDPDPIPIPDDAIFSVPALWHCDTPGCTYPSWSGQVITWPEWAAYENNARRESESRTVYSLEGEVMYPYMGSWANGCEVTAVSGVVLIVEWQRGTDEWRETYLWPGETHTITLTAPEDGALIESNDIFAPFAIVLNNCTPQPVVK